MSATALLWAALALALADWAAVARGRRASEYFTKPGVMLSLLLWLVANGGLEGRLAWFALGLALSLAGDVFLMLPNERFIAGLLSFLLAHLAYVAGFNSDGPPPLHPVSLGLALLALLVASQIYRYIARGLEAGGQGKLKVMILAYTSVIGLMLISAILTLGRPEWAGLPSLLASSGAALFVLSDSLLAWNRFVKPLPHGKLKVRVSYHLGQALIVLGAALRFL
ncbi:MAG: lysoplasmalogenase [Anaerolineales bacterium]|nr:lysoplasmalogenase [Anaerolineales bacterium]